MNPNIPSCSPLQLKSHHFTVVSIIASPAGSPAGATAVNQSVGFSPVPEQPNHWNLQLQLKMASVDSNAPFLYEIDIHILGVVEVSVEVSEELREQMAVINGLSLLYGACREMIINITARSVYGPCSIPALNFTKVIQEAQEHRKAQQAQLADREKNVATG